MEMKKLRGFRLRCKIVRIVRIFRCVARPGKIHARLYSARGRSPISLARILGLACFWRRGAKALSCEGKGKGKGKGSGSGYIQLGKVKPVEMPKGHLAVYVGESDGGSRREVVPVIYFNHPLFGELLKEAERIYGYNHPGGIQIPCGYSEFEKVKMRIADWDSSSRSSKHHMNW